MKRLLAAMTAALVMVALVASVAVAATPKITSVGTWKVALGPNYASTKSATTTGGAGVSFSTDPASYVDLLTTTQDKSLLGDLTGKSITATFTVTASTEAVYAYDLSGGNTCTPAVAFVRPYFKSNLKGAFAVTNYWWANATHYTFVDSATAMITVTVPVATGNWSDYIGEADSTVSGAFAQAITNVGQIGLSFGGGCFFANGVGLSAGSASFLLTSYSIS
jgi:hypothetical protein